MRSFLFCTQTNPPAHTPPEFRLFMQSLLAKRNGEPAEESSSKFSGRESTAFDKSHAHADAIVEVFLNSGGLECCFGSELMNAIAIIFGVVAHPELSAPHAEAFRLSEC